MKRSRNTALALLLIALFLALEYAWVETPHSRRERGGRGGSGLLTSLGRPGCPADPQQRRDLGAADMNWKLKKLDGTEITFAQFRGKVGFVNVWATWCGPCREEMPDIEALEKSLRGENVEFVLVSEEELDPVKKFVEKEGLSTPVYLSASTLPEVFESRGIPATFLVDPTGRVVHRRTGVAAWNNDTCRDYLRELQKVEPAAGPAALSRK